MIPFMDLHHCHLILLITCCCCLSDRANSQDIPIRKLRFEPASHKELNGSRNLIQDSQGFIWTCGRAGLNRYDGLEVKSFQEETENGCHPEGMIWDVMEDSFQQIWVAGNEGLFRFDRASQCFTKYFQDTSRISFLGPLQEDSDGYLWSFIGDPETEMALFRMNLKEVGYQIWPMTYLDQSDTLRNVLQDASNYVIDHNNHLWLATYRGLMHFRPEASEQSLYQIVPDQLYNAVNHIRDIHMDNQNRIWVATQGSGLLYFSLDQKQFFPAFSKPSVSGDHIKQTAEGLSKSLPDELWFSTGEFVHNASMYSINLNNLSVNHLDMAPIFGTSSTMRPAKVLLKDHSDNLWYGFFFNLLKYSKTHNHFRFITARQRTVDDLKGEGVVTVFEDKKGIIWIGSQNGIFNRWNPSTNRFRQYDLNTMALTAEAPGSITCITEDKVGRLWLGTWDNGLYIMDRRRETIRHFPYQKIDSFGISPSTHYLGTDSRGNLFLGTHMRGSGKEPGGLYKFEYEKNRFRIFPKTYREANRRYAPQYEEYYDFPFAVSTRDMEEDAHGNYWVCSLGGISYIDGQTEEVKESFSVNTLPHNIHLDDHQNLWIAGIKQGISKYHIPTKKLVHLDSLPQFRGNTIRTISPATNGDFWLHATEGMIRFDPKNEKVLRLYQNKTWMPETWEWDLVGPSRFLVTDEGQMMIPSRSGLLVFHPDSIKDHTLPPSIVFTDFMIDNDPQTYGSEQPLEKHVSVTEDIRLPYFHNNITIQFTAIHLKNPEKNRIQYRMLNLSDEWIEAGRERIARFLKVSPGSYTFQVRAANSDGYWTETSKELSITILPPWWQTWWAKTLYVMAVIGSIFGYIQWRTATLRKRQRILEKTVTERTAEVVAQKEVIQKEKERSDELLLNILPAETAEELKQFGAAQAKNYDTVTVLFTDFKDFTKVAEKLTPQELVAEIHSTLR